MFALTSGGMVSLAAGIALGLTSSVPLMHCDVAYLSIAPSFPPLHPAFPHKIKGYSLLFFLKNLQMVGKTHSVIYDILYDDKHFECTLMLNTEQHCHPSKY